MTDAFGSEPGVLLVAGTGSIAWARSRTGRHVRVGGWGRHLGDEGSGFHIGHATLHALARAADGRAPPTALTSAVLHHLGLAAAPDLIGWVAHAAKADIAALTPLTLAAAADDDPTALGIRDAAVRELVLLAVTAARQAELDRPAVALAGGLIEPGGTLRDYVVRALHQAFGQISVHETVVDGARGATLIARRPHR